MLYNKLQKTDLSDAEHNAIRQHIQRCDGCRKEWERLSKLDKIGKVSRQDRLHEANHSLFTEYDDMDTELQDGASIINFINDINARTDIPEPPPELLDEIIAENRTAQQSKKKIIRIAQFGALPLLGGVAASLILFFYCSHHTKPERIVQTAPLTAITQPEPQSDISKPAPVYVASTPQQHVNAPVLITTTNNESDAQPQQPEPQLVAGNNSESDSSNQDTTEPQHPINDEPKEIASEAKPLPSLADLEANIEANKEFIREATIKLKTTNRIAQVAGSVPVIYEEFINAYGERDFRLASSDTRDPKVLEAQEQILSVIRQINKILSDSHIQGNILGVELGPPPCLLVSVPVEHYDDLVSKLQRIGDPQKILSLHDPLDATTSDLDRNFDNVIHTKIIINISK